MAYFHTTNRALLHSTGVPGDIIYLTEDESFWLVIANPMRRVPVASLFSGVHQCARDGRPGDQGACGPAGLPGAPGRDGVNGSDGADGADGARGEQGLQGAPGRDGESVSLDAVVAAVIERLAAAGRTPSDIQQSAHLAMIEETKARARSISLRLASQ